MVKKHLRRLWFCFNPQEDWRLFGFDCVQFGDQPAATLMTIAVEKAANSYQAVAEKLNLPINEVKEDSRKLLQDTYVDNSATGGSRTQVLRMLGTRLKDGTYSGTIPAMLKQVGLKIKTIVTLVSQEPKDLAKLTDKVLGCLYNPREDLLGIKFVFNPSKK